MMQTTIAGVTFLMMAGTSRGPDIDPDNAFCRICQCTDDHACEGGCCWVTDPAGGDLCSACMDGAYQALQRHMRGEATEADLDLLHRFAETGPYTDTDPLNPAVAIARVPPDAA